MPSMTKFHAGSFLLGAALAAGAFFAGIAVTAPATGQVAAEGPLPKAAAPAADDGAAGVVGVSIPSGGAALIRGKDGYAYIVDSRGVFVKASQSGKNLQLP